MYVLYTESLKACLALLLFSCVVLDTVLPWVTVSMTVMRERKQFKGSLVTLATNSSFDKSTVRRGLAELCHVTAEVFCFC